MKTSNFKLKSASKQTSKKKPLLIIGLVIVLAGLATAGFLYNQHKNDLANQAEKQKAMDEAQTDSAKKTLDAEEASEQKNGTNSGVTTTDKVPTTESASIAVTEFSQYDGQVQASAIISGGTAQTCVFSYTAPEARPVVKQVSVENNKCTASIPETQFDLLGSRNLNVTAYIGDSKTEANKNVTIN